MKRHSFVVLVVCAALGFSLRAQADQIISVQYQTNGSALIGSNNAGVMAVSNWNTAALGYVSGTDNSLNNLKDSTGTGTSISENTHSDGGYDYGSGSSFTAGSGDATLFRGFALGNYGAVTDLTVTLTNLDPTHAYKLFAYVQTSNTGDTVSGTAGGTTYYLKSASLSSYVRGVASSSASAVEGNYFQFDNLTGSTSQVFTYSGANTSHYTGLSGFQLIDTGAAPEPASLGLLVVGAMFVMPRGGRRPA